MPLKKLKKNKPDKKKPAVLPKKKPKNPHIGGHMTKPPKPSDAPTKPNPSKKLYVSNKEFFKELMACQRVRVMSNELGKIFILLSERYASKWSFASYSYRDELVQDGIVACCGAFMKFNRKKGSNCFAFFTSVVHNAFIARLNREKKVQRIRDKILIEMSMDPSASYREFLDSDEVDYDLESRNDAIRAGHEATGPAESMELDHMPTLDE